MKVPVRKSVQDLILLRHNRSKHKENMKEFIIPNILENETQLSLLNFFN